MIKIYFEENNEYAEFEASKKGIRMDIFVQVEDDIYNLTFYSIDRISEEFYKNYHRKGYYLTPPNLVILKEITTKSIIETTLKLVEQNFFQKLGCYSEVDLEALAEVYPNTSPPRSII
ncbi:MAG: hypothetical protein EAZ95_03000 [Bacteroidetes bacterium]|nr:MAG: hypothetical protein EAZ95_03000 [Bacteroidota bacterium]